LTGTAEPSSTAAAAEQNATATGSNATDTGRNSTTARQNRAATLRNIIPYLRIPVRNHVYNEDFARKLRLVLLFVAFFALIFFVFAFIIPNVIILQIVGYAVFTELSLYFNRVYPNLSNALFYLIYNCHLLFFTIFAVVGLAGFYLVMWRSSNFHTHTTESTRRDEGMNAE
jgi:hypothetical protein